MNKASPELLYRTGDYVCFNERGELMYRGRADHQIKHMGYRIELGEIESAAASIPGVERAVCIYDGEKRQIILFYAGQAEDAALRGQLLRLLPAYMMPARILHRVSLPMTSTGKADRVKLAELYRQTQ